MSSYGRDFISAEKCRARNLFHFDVAFATAKSNAAGDYTSSQSDRTLRKRGMLTVYTPLASTFMAIVSADDYKYAAKRDWTCLFDLQMRLFNLNLRGAAIRRKKRDHDETANLSRRR